MPANLPAHLANRQSRNLSEASLAGMSGALPPHVSIRSNRFTLVDAAGNKQTLDSLYLDCCFVDLSDKIAKLYYEGEFEEGSDDPPTCWSADGITPSNEAVSKQARTCAECQWNVRGSDTSKLSGKPIKACRDEKWSAVTLVSVQMNPQKQVVGSAPLHPEILWQFKITPGSFKNWRAYAKRCQDQGVDMSLLVTRIGFEQGKNGVLTFQPVSWIDAATADVRDKAWESKATDVLVGRNLPAIAAPPPMPALAAPAAAAMGAQLPQTAPQTQEPKRRRGRPAASQTAAPAANPAPANGPAAPFMQEQQQFGIAPAAPPPNDLAKTLDDFFGPQS